MVVLSRPARLSRALDTKNNCLNPAIDQANISSATLARTSSIVCTDDQRSCYFFPSKAASKLEQVKNQSICVPLWKCPSSRTPTNLPSCQNELKGQNPPNPSIAAPWTKFPAKRGSKSTDDQWFPIIDYTRHTPNYHNIIMLVSHLVTVLLYCST